MQALRAGFSAILLTIALAFGSPQARAQDQGKDRDCTAAEAREGDRWAWLNARDRRGSIERHLPWGEPTETVPTTGERTFVLTDYVNRFDTDLRVPIWSAERIDWSRLRRTARIDCFRPHPQAVSASDLLNDYDEPLYDQGHLTPAADQDSSVTAMVNTFFYTNMAPQHARFNRGIWGRLEAIVRTWVQRNGTVYVISGSVFDRDSDGRRDPDASAERMSPRRGPARVAVPTAFFKIVTYRRADGRLSTLTIMLPHQPVRLSGRALGNYFQTHVTTVSQIEQVTGLNFFPNQAALGEETQFCTFGGGAPRNLCN